MEKYVGGTDNTTGDLNDTNPLVLSLPVTHSAGQMALAFVTSYNGVDTVGLTPNAEYTELVDSILKDAQDETLYTGSAAQGTFVGGTGYSVSDTLTMSDGSTVTVDNVSTGVVTEFTVDATGASPGTKTDDVLTATGGTGNDDFTLTPGATNLTGFPFYSKAGSKNSIKCYYRFLTSSSDTDLTLTKAATCRAGGVLVLLNDIDSGSPFIGTAQTDNIVNHANRAVPPPISPDVDNGMLFLVAQITTNTVGEGVTTLGVPATPAGLTSGQARIGTVRYQDFVTAYDEDYGPAATFTPTRWTYKLFDGKIFDGGDETDYDSGTGEGTFAGGTGHAISDVITITGGATVTVDNVSAGVVTEFTVTQGADTGGHSVDDVLSQTGTTGSGTGFSVTLGPDNLAGGSWEVGMATLALRTLTAAPSGNDSVIPSIPQRNIRKRGMMM